MASTWKLPTSELPTLKWLLEEGIRAEMILQVSCWGISEIYDARALLVEETIFVSIEAPTLPVCRSASGYLQE